MKIKDIMQKTITELLSKGADKVAVKGLVNSQEELQYEYNEIDLLRGYTENKLNIVVIKNQKRAAISINQLDDRSISLAVNQVMEDAQNSQPDKAYDISEVQEPARFKSGPLESDREGMYRRIEEFLAECAEKYPTVSLEGNITHYLVKENYLNSNGVDFEEIKGGYVYVSMFSAREGKKVSSFNYCYGIYNDLKRTFFETGLTRELIEQSVASLDCQPIPETFDGDVILVPGLANEFMSSIVYGQLSDNPLITGNSVLKGRIGEKVLDKKVHLVSDPLNPELAGGYNVTDDGYAAERVDIFDKGELKNYMLSLFGSRKTGLPMSKAGGCFILEGGNEELSEMIKDIRKGLYVVRFSGGNPSINGDFSGIAKNSYYIEDGKIKYPVNETMISGNLLQLFNDVKGISRKRLNSGNWIMPWVSCRGVTVSR